MNQNDCVMDQIRNKLEFYLKTSPPEQSHQEHACFLAGYLQSLEDFGHISTEDHNILYQEYIG